MKVVIVGCGHVGLVTAVCFAELGHDVVGVDSDPDRLDLLRRGEAPFHEAQLPELLARHAGGALSFEADVGHALDGAAVAFICVETPASSDGTPSLAFVERATRAIAGGSYGPLVIVEKSTVPVHTARRILDVLVSEGHPDIEVAINPEFLREGSAVQDALSPDRIVVGLADGEGRAEEVLRELYSPLISRTGCPLIVTDLETAELIKHASNTFLALKISYINAVARLCERTGADVDLVAAGMGLDGRIGPDHLRAGLGYGGSCLPKDLAAFVDQAAGLGVDLSFLDNIRRLNIEQRQLLIDKIHRALGKIEGKTLAIWGLAFKPGTDDLREAPSLDVVPALETQGAIIRAYDPAAAAAAKVEFPTIEIVADAMSAVEGADALVVLTDWAEFADTDLTQLAAALRRPVVVDGRNLWPVQRMAELGFTYISFGRPEVVAGEIRRPAG